MAGVDISIHVDTKDVERKLKLMSKDGVRQVMQRTMSDMRSAGPSIIARIAAETYELPRTKLNPRTKSGKGTVSMSGASLASIAWQYKGDRLAIGGKGFRLRPAQHRMTSSYTAKTAVLKGREAILGRWNKPWSEGGAKSAVSPWFVVNGLAQKRHGRSIDLTARGPSIPQMVLSVRSQDRLQQELQTKAFERLEHHIAQWFS